VGERSVEYEILLYCKIFNWVRRSTLQLGVKINPIAGCQEGRDREKKKEDLLAESTDKNYMLHLNTL
jgi:hypothetical protein